MGLEDDHKELKKRFETYIRRTATQEQKVAQIQLHGCTIHRYTPVVGEDKIAVRYLFPCGGTIQKVLLRCPKATEKVPIRVTFEFWRGNTAKSRTLLMTKIDVTAEIQVDVEEGDRLLVLVSIDGMNVDEFETSFLFVPNGPLVRKNIDLSLFGDYVDERIRDLSTKTSNDRTTSIEPKSNQLTGSNSMS